MSTVRTSVQVKDSSSNNVRKEANVRYPFWLGGSASCFAACVTHPLDLVKVRLQIRTLDAPRSMYGTFIHVSRHEGFLGLYSGLSASMLRQLTYSTVRFGIYEELKSSYTTPNYSPALPELVAMASISGFVGGLVGNPADVLNVRMQHDALQPPQLRRNYKNAIDGLVRMTREEGARALFRGVWPNSTRAVLMTVSQLASYDKVKVMLVEQMRMGDGLVTQIAASCAAGIVATTVCSPVDVVKTRIMSAHESKELVRLLSGIYKAEGLSWIFRGWMPSFIRLGPHTVATFLFLEQHKRLYNMLTGIEGAEGT